MSWLPWVAGVALVFVLLVALWVLVVLLYLDKDEPAPGQHVSSRYAPRYEWGDREHR